MSYFLIVQTNQSQGVDWDSFGQQARRILGQRFIYSGSLTPKGCENTRLLFWKLRGSDDLHFIQKGSMWAVLNGQADPNDLADSLIFEGGGPKLRTSVWGRYSTVVGSIVSDLLHGWQTVPAMESINFSKVSNAAFLSNSSLVTQLARQFHQGQELRPQYCDDGMKQYLAVGYTFGETSMFAEVKQVPPRGMVSLSSSMYPQISQVPAGNEHSLPRDHSLEESGKALADSLRNSFARAIKNNNGVIDMRVSGGKDSRIMLGLAQEFGVSVSATCIGSGTDLDSRIAKALSSASGATFTCRNSPAYDYQSAWGSTNMSLKATLGVPQSESHFSPNEFTSPDFPGQKLFFGNWPAYHGVYHRKMRYTKEEVETVSRNIVDSSVSADVRDQIFSSMTDWFTLNPAQSLIHQLYEFGLQFRGSNWMKPAFTGWSSQFECCFFMSDQELTSLADRLTMMEHVTYAPEFIALKNIWPEASRIPLANDKWKFEVLGRSQHAELDPDGYDHRNPSSDRIDRDFPPFEPNGSKELLSLPVYADSVANEMVNYLLTSSAFHQCILPLLSEDFVHKVRSSQQGYNLEDKRKIWRVFALTCAVSLAWFELS